MKRILVFTTTLGLGGITSHTVNLVNELSKSYDVTLAYTGDEAAKLTEISSNVKTVSFDFPNKKKTLSIMSKYGWIHHAIKVKFRKHNRVSPMYSLQRIAYAQAEGTELPNVLLKHYDVAISTAEFYCNDIVALKLEADIKIGWIHPDYRALKADVDFDRKILDKFKWIAVVSEDNKRILCETISDYRGKVVYVPNLLNRKMLQDKSAVMPNEYKNADAEHIIVTVCRIDNSSKRLDRAVKICKALEDKGEDFVWFIVGDGTDSKALKEMIRKNSLQKHMIMLGGRINPYPYIKYADLFVLTSQYEGRPITVDEALTLGCPVIVSNYGAAEEQVHPEFGSVIDNSDDKIVDAFCKCLDWEIIKEQRRYLENNDVLVAVKNKFDESIELIIKP